MNSSSELKIACLSLCLENLEKKPSVVEEDVVENYMIRDPGLDPRAT
jgi:hypothetical protein